MSKLQTRKYTFTLQANGSFNLLVAGNYFRVQSAQGTINVQANNGAFFMESLVASEGIEKTPFDSLMVTDTSGAPNQVTILIADQNYVGGTIGQISLASSKVPQSAAFAHSAPALTIASTQVLAANANRQYLLIQNKDSVANAYVSLDGAAATIARGIKIAPGGNLELSTCVPTGAITWIGDAASANLVVVQG